MAVIGSNGSAVLTTEQDKLDFESVSEYIREPRGSAKDSYATKSNYFLEDEAAPLSKSAELETLWPGVSADFLHGHHGSKKQPSFYWGIGFASGVSATVVLTAIVFGMMHLFAAATNPQTAARIVLAQGKSSSTTQMGSSVATESGAVVTRVNNLPPSAAVGIGGPEVIVPIYSNYTVKNGDTLAGIALQAYKRATPRLMDEICRANGMRNANVLSLGQTIVLPEYRPQSNQIASGATSIQ